MAKLDAHRIALASWKIVDERGLAAFTVRAVADELGISPMAMYHHVPNKAALVSLMVEIANTELPVDPTTGKWDEDLWLMAKWMRQTRLAHPALADLRRTYRVWTPSLLKIADGWVTLWLQSGLAAEKALVAARASSQAVTGMVDEEAAYEGEPPPSEELLAAAPATRIMFAKNHRPEHMFELATRSVIEGLFIQLAKPSPQSQSSRPRKQPRATAPA